MKDKLLNILLFPMKFYERLTDRKLTLYLGILLVGAIDMLLPDAAKVLGIIFDQKTAGNTLINSLMLVLVIIVLGIVDVTFVSIPLYDFFNFLKGKESKFNVMQQTQDPDINAVEPSAPSIATRIKVMKSYIMLHFFITPVSVAVYFLFTRNVAETSSDTQLYLALLIEMLTFIWLAAILSRGINTLFKFNPIFARLTFIVVFTWNFIFSMAFSGQIMKWVWKLFV